MDETPYLIELDPTDRGGSPLDDVEDDETNVVGDEDDEAPAESPLELNMSDDKWASLGDEFQEFMDESDEDLEGNISNSDSESNRSDSSVRTTDSKRNRRKRKRVSASANVSEGEESDSSVSSTSRLQMRKKRTLERVTSLTNVVTADKSSGLPSPETTGPEEEQGDEEKNNDPAGLAADDSDADDGLEAEMLAGLAADSEDEDS